VPQTASIIARGLGMVNVRWWCWRWCLTPWMSYEAGPRFEEVSDTFSNW